MSHDPIDAPPNRGGSGKEHQIGRSVIELVGVHRADDRQFIGNPGDVRQQLADPGSSLAVLRELMGRPQHFRVPLDEREFLVLEQFIRAGLHVELYELGLVVEQILLRRRAGHFEINNAAGSGRQRWSPRRQRPIV